MDPFIAMMDEFLKLFYDKRNIPSTKSTDTSSIDILLHKIDMQTGDKVPNMYCKPAKIELPIDIYNINLNKTTYALFVVADEYEDVEANKITALQTNEDIHIPDLITTADKRIFTRMPIESHYEDSINVIHYLMHSNMKFYDMHKLGATLATKDNPVSINPR